MALGDAIASACPPKKRILFDWPDALRLDGGRLGGGRLGWPEACREEDVPAPVNAYGRSKAEAELRVADAHPGATIARTSLIYGTPDGPQERLAREGRRFYVDEVRSPVHVDDLAAALLELLALDVPGPLHVAGADDVNRFDFAVLLGADPASIEPAQTRPERAPDVTLDSSQAARLLKTRLRGAREVLAHG